MYSHTSDHSACNHAVQVVKESLRRSLVSSSDGGLLALASAGDAGCAAVRVLDAAHRRSRQLVTARPGSEALWYLRRMLWTMLTDALGRYCTSPGVVQADETARCDAEIDILGRIVSITIHDNGDQQIEPGNDSWAIDIDLAEGSQLALILIRLAVGEARLVASQARPNAGVMWNEEKQRDFALRYLAHVLTQVN
jgi:hypothetical protein